MQCVPSECLDLDYHAITALVRVGRFDQARQRADNHPEAQAVHEFIGFLCDIPVNDTVPPLLDECARALVQQLAAIDRAVLVETERGWCWCTQEGHQVAAGPFGNEEAAWLWLSEEHHDAPDSGTRPALLDTTTTQPALFDITARNGQQPRFTEEHRQVVACLVLWRSGQWKVEEIDGLDYLINNDGNPISPGHEDGEELLKWIDRMAKDLVGTDENAAVWLQQRQVAA